MFRRPLVAGGLAVVMLLTAGGESTALAAPSAGTSSSPASSGASVHVPAASRTFAGRGSTAYESQQNAYQAATDAGWGQCRNPLTNGSGTNWYTQVTCYGPSTV